MLNQCVAFAALANAMDEIVNKLKSDNATVPVLVADIQNSTISACTPRQLNDGSGRMIRPVHLLEILEDLSYGLFPCMTRPCHGRLSTDPQPRELAVIQRLHVAGQGSEGSQKNGRQGGQSVYRHGYHASMPKNDIAACIEIAGQQNVTAGFMQYLFSPPQQTNNTRGAKKMTAFYNIAVALKKDVTLPVVDILWNDVRQLVAQNKPLSSIVQLLKTLPSWGLKVPSMMVQVSCFYTFSRT
ncbi:unnamed protein product [Vitrella brassicaformis CCMP3155]|uniref:Uncharacterized protein n=1 Tax=Vitrella brassicaformis (strain CCMP3155) TaxID=1169540 RepID=A0A0G4E952_VITBC|nr:unnamed protein product [Vitrella brassicaformis CCMP3155]|eukprot:CEL91740.1 unnamed protein product [Vitrella brassicaformis CCMP3155]